MLLEFQSSAFDRSAISPRSNIAVRSSAPDFVQRVTTHLHVLRPCGVDVESLVIDQFAPGELVDRSAISPRSNIAERSSAPDFVQRVTTHLHVLRPCGVDVESRHRSIRSWRISRPLGHLSALKHCCAASAPDSSSALLRTSMCSAPAGSMSRVSSSINSLPAN
jgi:hypothetical protein